MHRFRPEDLRRFAVAALRNEGVPQTSAEDAAAVLEWASVRGVDTHGFRNLKRYYVDGIRDGSIDPQAVATIDRQHAGTQALSGNKGLGLSISLQAMRMTIASARDHDVGITTVRHSNHFGAAGCYADLAADAGMLGLVMNGYFFHNGQPGSVLPFGGSLPMLSTNPIAFACPCGSRPPFVLDMSTSVVPVNRLELYSERGAEIPAGWAVDREGLTTTSPNNFGAVLPLGGMDRLGGHKGTGLALMVQILAGVLSSAWRRGVDEQHALGENRTASNGYAQEGVGHFFAAIRIDRFLPLDQFESAMSEMIDCLNGSPSAAGTDQVRVAGQPEAETRQRRLSEGIPLEPHVEAELRTLAGPGELTFPDHC